MRKFSLLVVALLFATSLLNAAGMVYVPAATSENAAVVPSSKQSVEKFLSLTPAKIQEMTGKKMTLKEKIAFKLVQAKVKKQVKKGGSAEIPQVLYVILAILGFAWIAMGIMDNWSGNNWWVNLILTLLFWLPGLIHALIKMKDYYN